MFQRIRWVHLLVAVPLPFAACETERTGEPGAAANPPTGRTADVQAEEQAIRELSRQWMEATRANDADRMAQFYAEDAVSHPPGEQPNRGRNTIREYYAGMSELELRQIEANITQVDVAASGDLAYELGEFVFVAEGRQGRTDDRGPYLNVWKKRNGQWQIVHEIWNNRTSASPAQPRPGG